MIRNPTDEVLRQMAKDAGDGLLRWIEDAAGNRFVWPADAGGHKAAAAALGIPWPWRQGLIEITSEAVPRSRQPNP